MKSKNKTKNKHQKIFLWVKQHKIVSMAVIACIVVVIGILTFVFINHYVSSDDGTNTNSAISNREALEKCQEERVYHKNSNKLDQVLYPDGSSPSLEETYRQQIYCYSTYRVEESEEKITQFESLLGENYGSSQVGDSSQESYITEPSSQDWSSYTASIQDLESEYKEKKRQLEEQYDDGISEEEKARRQAEIDELDRQWKERQSEFDKQRSATEIGTNNEEHPQSQTSQNPQEDIDGYEHEQFCATEVATLYYLYVTKTEESLAGLDAEAQEYAENQAATSDGGEGFINAKKAWYKQQHYQDFLVYRQSLELSSQTVALEDGCNIYAYGYDWANPHL